MPITFTCPGCNKALRVGDELAGKECRCPSCATVLLVPGGVAESAVRLPSVSPIGRSPTRDSETSGADSPRFKKKKKARRGSGKAWFWAGGVAVGLLLLAGLGLLGFWLFFTGTRLKDELRYLPDDFTELQSVNFDAIRASGVYAKIVKDVPKYLELEYGEFLDPELGLKFDDISRVTDAGKGNDTVRVIRAKREYQSSELTSQEGRQWRERRVEEAVIFEPVLIGQKSFFVSGRFIILGSVPALEKIVRRKGDPSLAGKMKTALGKADFAQAAVFLKEYELEAPPRKGRHRKFEGGAYLVWEFRYRGAEITDSYTIHCPDSATAREEYVAQRQLLEERKGVVDADEKNRLDKTIISYSGSTVTVTEVYSAQDKVREYR